MNDKKTRVAIRGFQKTLLVFEERFELTEAELESTLPGIAERHAIMLVGAPHMIEIEFLDEENLNERFFRFGTDPAGMVAPIAIAL